MRKRKRKLKSQIVLNCVPKEDQKNYSELKVLKSNAGYYIGTTYIDPEYGFEEPGSRDSYYFSTYESASNELDLLLKDESNIILRDKP